MPMQYAETMPWGDDHEQELEVTFTYRPGCPAQTYGPAENCYPAEAAEFDIVSALVDGTAIEISDEERSTIEEWLQDNFEAEDDGQPDADYLYDLRRDEEMMDA